MRLQDATNLPSEKTYVRHDDADVGVDLYTTSMLLGHTNVKMTQVYAKIINQKKDDAVNIENGLLGIPRSA